MIRFYVYADESGDFEFSDAPNVSRFFILCTVVMQQCHVGSALLELRRQLAWERAPLGHYFHATDDKQAIRDAVFDTIVPYDFSIQATILEKSKAAPGIRTSKVQLYRHAWYYHLRFGIARQVPKSAETLITAAAIQKGREQAAFSSAVDEALRQTMKRRAWRTDFPHASSDPCVQVADYCAWAIRRRWERGDDRSYERIKQRITYEHDLFHAGKMRYY